MRCSLLVVGLLGVLLLAGCTEAGNAPSPGSDSTAASAPPQEEGRLQDNLEAATLAARIRLALLDTVSLRPFDFTVEVEARRVAVRGTVHTAEQRRLAESITRAVKGVGAVRNEIVVAPDTTRSAASDSVRAVPTP